ncbi:hypothetical protein HO944_06575 [Streptococcus suis]|uniref:hypothetical protein n=1 Tax=Streptococcus suis TaxID=1307 RepID=UPI0005CF0574|nr:hypothetical protein [Streptococcus suis]MDW8713676.1 hypothetical protein [Streptococcus suis]NQH51245.1 hypothetical protein [Streptococcus suis]NQM34424.1 hypothetical protein [Streptococcus suis]NQO80916.1 hypothetical protein [Streptococcus suis]NQO89215.1 hypothetical protein [Streptococcus suis]
MSATSIAGGFLVFLYEKNWLEAIIVNKNKQNDRRSSYENLEKLSFTFNLLSHLTNASTFRGWMESDYTNYQQINKIPPSHHSGKEEKDWKLYVEWRGWES